MKRALLALLLAAPALAGCIAADGVDPASDAEALLARVSQAVYDEVIAEHMPVESFDGTLLDMWVYRPATGEGGERVPVIINFSPYWSNLAPPAGEGGDAFSQYLIDYHVPRGYAVALVSARGTGLSEGCFTIGGPDEVQDMGLVVDALATQPWSNGNVTATGKSYDGTMAQGLLTLDNPHVKTIVPVSPISELYKYNHYNGVPYSNGFVTNEFNTYYVLLVSLAQADDPTHPTWEKTPTRFCDESVDVQTNQYHSTLTGDYTPYWQARNYTAMLPARVEPSVFYIHGLQDWNVKPDHMDPWIRALQERGSTVKLWLGQWEHDYPTRDDWNLTMLRWFDHYLKGIDTGILDEPLAQVQDQNGLWRHEESWPPARTTPLALHTDASGKLQPEPGSGDARYLDAPTPPGAPLASASFTWTVPEGGLRVAGSPVLHALVSSTGPRATLSATLLLDGEPVDSGFLDLAHRDGLETSAPMQPGAEYAVRVPFFPQDLHLPGGSTLTLLIGHTSPGPAGVSPNPTSSVVSLHHGQGTWLELPTLAADDITPEARQPEDVGCWAC